MLSPPLSQPFFFVARKRRLEKREPAGETETALSAPGGAVPLSRQKIIGSYIGGGVLLDTFTAEEIKKIVVERLGLLIKGADIGLGTDLEYSSEEVLDMEEETGDAEEVNIDFGEYLDLLEPITDIDIDNVLGALNEVEYGCIIHIHKMPEDTYFISNMPMADGTLNMMQKWFLGKGVGASWQHAKSTYEIVDIRRS